jgi:hypothetical protein
VASQIDFIVLEKLMVAQLVRKLPHPTLLILSSQEPTNGSYPEENHVDTLSSFTWV